MPDTLPQVRPQQVWADNDPRSKGRTLKVLAAQNKLPAAKKHYNEMRSMLRSELGVDGSPETLRLAAELGLE